jgi:hypothetical protein
VQTNVDPKLHPLEAPREYKRALNAGRFPAPVHDFRCHAAVVCRRPRRPCLGIELWRGCGLRKGVAELLLALRLSWLLLSSGHLARVVFFESGARVRHCRH